MNAWWSTLILVAGCLATGWFSRWLYDGALILRFNRESYEKGRADERKFRQIPEDHPGNSDLVGGETAAPAVLAVPVPSPLATVAETLAVPDAARLDLPGRHDDWEPQEWQPGQLRRMRDEIDAEGGYADFSSRLSAFIATQEEWMKRKRAELADDRQRLGLPSDSSPFLAATAAVLGVQYSWDLPAFTVTGGRGKLLVPTKPGGRHART